MPRRHWDITFAGALFPVEFHPAVGMFQALMGIGGLIAVTGALMYIAIAVVTVFFGKKLTEADIQNGASGIPQGVLKLPPQVHTGAHVQKAHLLGAKGTVVLVTIFLICFVLYYFTNWKMLSFLWKVG